MGLALWWINARLGFRLGSRPVPRPVYAVLGFGRAARRRAGIHGGRKAREKNVEEAVASSGCSPARGKIPNPRDTPQRWHGHENGEAACSTKLSSKAASTGP